MESREVERTISNKVIKIYLLAIIFVLISTVQWCLLINLESFKFLINAWMLSGALIALIFIMSAQLVANCLEKRLPATLEWVFAMSFVEILVIALSALVYHVDSFLLYSSLILIPFLMAVLTVVAVRISKVHQNYFKKHLIFCMLVVYSLNMTFLMLIFIFFVITKADDHLYSISIYIISSVAYPILILNILFASMLIVNDLYKIKTLTGCLKPATYIYGIFASLLWFTLSLATQIGKIK